MTESLTLDHVGVVFDDLDDARRLYEALGFTLAPRSMHAGNLEPGGPVVPWGSGNHCIMLERGYIELVGLVDRRKYSNIKPLLDRHAGAHIIAFRTQDSARAYERLVADGIKARPAAKLEREIDEPPGAKVAFSNIYFDPEQLPEAYFIVIRHETPKLMWKPALLSHPNTAVSLETVTVVVADAECSAVADKLGRAFPATTGNGEPALRVVAAGDWRAPLPGELPCVAAYSVGVRDLDACRGVLTAAGVEFATIGDAAVVVAPERCGGAEVTFRQA